MKWLQEQFWKEECLGQKFNSKKKKRAKPSTLALRPATQLFIKGQRLVVMIGSHLSSNLDPQASSSSMHG